MLWSGTPYSSRDAYGPIEACKIPTVLSGSRPHRSGTSQRYATPLRILYAPSVIRRARAPQSAPAGHRPTGPGLSRHPPRVHSPGRRYPSLRVIGPVVAAEHMSDGRTRAHRTCPGTTSMCTAGPALGRAGRPGHERTLRQALGLAVRVRHGTYSTAVPRQKGAGQPTAHLSRRHRGSEAGGLIHPLWPSPSLEGSPASRPSQVGLFGRRAGDPEAVSQGSGRYRR